MNLYELGKYKQDVLGRLRNDKTIQKILLDGMTVDEEYLDMELDKVTYPYLFLPTPQQTEKKTYICIDTIVPYVEDATFKDIKIIVYAYTHRDLMNFNLEGFIGTRVDILSDAIDRLLNNTANISIGRLKLENVDLFNSEKTYYGRIIEYSGTDFNTDKRLS